jgi:hypothetical protein
MWSAMIFASDLDDDPLSYTLSGEYPVGLSIDGTGTVSWYPDTSQVGIHRFMVYIQDPGGSKDSIRLNVTVLDQIHYRPDIFITKSLYNSYCENIYVGIKDPAKNRPSILDTVSITIHSLLQGHTHTLTLHESKINSGEFMNTFQINKVGTAGKLKVGESDTLLFVYQSPTETITRKAYFKDWTQSIHIKKVGSLAEDGYVLLIAPEGFRSYEWSDGTTAMDTIIVMAEGEYSLQITDIYGCKYQSDTIEISLENVSVSKHYDSQYFSLYPNPANKTITVEFQKSNDDPYKIMISDVNGRALKIIDNVTSEHFEINVEDLRSGLYLMTIKGSKIYRRRFIVE